MSRYLLLFLLNVPFILAAILGAVTQYKLGNISRRRMILQLALWLIIMAGLASAELIYRWLFSNNLTRTEPLSLFDVIQTTGIVITFYIANKTRATVERQERRLNDLHQELSIRLSREDS